MEHTLAEPNKLTQIEPSNLAAEPLDEVNDGTDEDDGITQAAATLTPAVAEECRDPEWKETDPN